MVLEAPAGLPQVDVEARGRDGALPDRNHRRRLLAQRMADLDLHGLAVWVSATDPDIAATIHGVAAVAMKPLCGAIGGEALARAAGVEEQPGRAPNRAGLVEDLDRAPRPQRVGRAGRRSGATASATLSGAGGTPSRVSV